MTEKNNIRASAALIYLSGCIINGTKPSAELIKDIPVAEIYTAALKNSLEAIAVTALEKIGITSTQSTEKKLMAVRKALIFDNARAEILSKFEKAEIKYMPLKGVIMKELYPEIGLRQMSDNDILFDKSRRADVKAIMQDLGYSVEYYETSNQDVYYKKPVLNFEMHTELFVSADGREFSEYYSSLFDRLLKDEDNLFGYRFEDNDYYIYIKAHEYKHFAACGTGLRSLLDSYVYLRAKGNTLDFDYISAECRKLGMADYERETRLLALAIFSPEISEQLLTFAIDGKNCPISEQAFSLLMEFVRYGTYGTMENNIINHVTNEAKGTKTVFGARVKFLFKRIFPPVSHFVDEKPKRAGKGYLYPIWWIGRTLEIIFKRPLRTTKTVINIFKAKAKK